MTRPRKPGESSRWPVPCGRCGQRPDRRQLVRRTCLRLLLPASQTHPRRLRLRPRGCPPGQSRRTTSLSTLLGVAAQRRLPQLRRRGRALRRRSLLDLRPHRHGRSASHQPHNRCDGARTGASRQRAEVDEAGEQRPLTWIKQKHVTEFLTQLAVAPMISHTSLDQLPVSRTP